MDSDTPSDEVEKVEMERMKPTVARLNDPKRDDSCLSSLVACCRERGIEREGVRER